MKSEINDLRKLIDHIPIKKVGISEGNSLNHLYLSQGVSAIEKILNSSEISVPTEEIPALTTESQTEQVLGAIAVIHEGKLMFEADNNRYYIMGSLSYDLSTMQVTLIVEEKTTGRKERTKIDLYEREAVRYFSRQVSESFRQDTEQVEQELLQFTDELEQYREKQLEQVKNRYEQKRNYQLISPEQQKQSIQFLQQSDLIENIDKMIEKSGVVGELNTRKLIFVIASTYKMDAPLHALVQGTSGSGKSHLINTIGQCFPPEDVMSMTRVTSKSFYHYSKEELIEKLLLIQDFDGLDEEAQYAFRELQSAGMVSSSTTYKDRAGNLTSAVKTVKSHFASLLATTRAEVYYDNMSRSIIIGVDESEEQTLKIIDYQNRKLSGEINSNEERKSREFLQNVLRCIKPCEVINIYANKVKLPSEAKMLRRLNNHFQSFVKQITVLHQYQREKDEQGRLVTKPEDLQIACDLLFDAIILKVDDLDSSLRWFFDSLKTFIKQKSPDKTSEYEFTQRDIRLAMNMSKASCFRYMEDLERLEYVQRTGGYINKGYRYKVVYWDDIDKLRTKIKKELNSQLEKISPLVAHSGSSSVNRWNSESTSESL